MALRRGSCVKCGSRRLLVERVRVRFKPWRRRESVSCRCCGTRQGA